MASASAIFDKDAVGGENVVDDIILAFQFAENDPYRAVTHNKGVMNGTISVANATGQDSRAIEAAAHAYAAKSGSYRSLTKWAKDANGNLVGDFELPLSVGIVGGVIQHHPIAKIHGGFKAKAEQSYSIGQIQIVNVDVQSSMPKVIGASTEILNLANSKSNTLPKMGKGAKEVSCKDLHTDSGNMLIV